MLILRVIEIIAIFLFILGMLSEIIIPLIRNRPLFPMLNLQRRRLEEDLAVAGEEQDLEDLRGKIKQDPHPRGLPTQTDQSVNNK